MSLSWTVIVPGRSLEGRVQHHLIDHLSLPVPLVLSQAVLSMQDRIVELGLWGLGTGGKMAQLLIIPSEQGIQATTTKDAPYHPSVWIVLYLWKTAGAGHNAATPSWGSQPVLNIGTRGSSMNGPGNNDKQQRALVRTAFSLRKRKRSGHTRDGPSLRLKCSRCRSA